MNKYRIEKDCVIVDKRSIIKWALYKEVKNDTNLQWFTKTKWVRESPYYDTKEDVIAHCKLLNIKSYKIIE